MGFFFHWIFQGFDIANKIYHALEMFADENLILLPEYKENWTKVIIYICPIYLSVNTHHRHGIGFYSQASALLQVNFSLSFLGIKNSFVVFKSRVFLSSWCHSILFNLQRYKFCAGIIILLAMSNQIKKNHALFWHHVGCHDIPPNFTLTKDLYSYSWHLWL